MTNDSGPRIYTKTGDHGETGLIDGSRVPKDHPRVSAGGDVDELNAWLGVVRAHAGAGVLDTLLEGIQRDLFALGAQLADPSARISEKKRKAVVGDDRIHALESAIDEYQAQMPPLRTFLLPGGSTLGALLHLSRGVCRRAERSVVALAREQPVAPNLLIYLNRLSDLLFVLARSANRHAGLDEKPW